MLLTLTQYEDRDDMFIANSIQRAPASLEETNALFGHDIVYDWVNYSTSIGIDLLAAHFFDSLGNRAFKENISNNQVVYNTTIVKPAPHVYASTLVKNSFVKASILDAQSLTKASWHDNKKSISWSR